MTTRQKALVRIRDEPLCGAFGLIVAAERLINARTSPDGHKGVLALIEAVRAELAKALVPDPRG